MAESMQILTGLGLSGAAGLNAYIVLLVTGLLGRFGVIALQKPFDLLENAWVLAALAILLAIELVVDKVPGLDHLNDLVQTFIRPVAGAFLFAASAGYISGIHPGVALVIGLTVALGVHAAKATARPVVTASTLGTGNWVVSLAEDLVALLGAVLAIIAPVLVVLLLALVLLVAWAMWRRLRRRAAT